MSRLKWIPIRHEAGRLSIADACPVRAGDFVTTNSGGYAMSLTHESTTVDAWLEWFATEKQAACRAYLCTRYRLDALDA
jgi:hypothetical protein